MDLDILQDDSGPIIPGWCGKYRVSFGPSMHVLTYLDPAAGSKYVNAEPGNGFKYLSRAGQRKGRNPWRDTHRTQDTKRGLHFRWIPVIAATLKVDSSDCCNHLKPDVSQY